MAMSTEARELTLHAENNEHLWNRRRPEFLKNEIRKRLKGQYDKEKAAKLWEYFADEAAASYVQEYGARGPHGKYGIFSKSERREAARYFRDLADDQWRSGEIKRYHSDLFPKGSKKKRTKKKASKKATVASGRQALRSALRRES